MHRQQKATELRWLLALFIKETYGPLNNALYLYLPKRRFSRGVREPQAYSLVSKRLTPNLLAGDAQQEAALTWILRDRYWVEHMPRIFPNLGTTFEQCVTKKELGTVDLYLHREGGAAATRNQRFNSRGLRIQGPLEAKLSGIRQDNGIDNDTLYFFIVRYDYEVQQVQTVAGADFALHETSPLVYAPRFEMVWFKKSNIDFIAVNNGVAATNIHTINSEAWKTPLATGALYTNAGRTVVLGLVNNALGGGGNLALTDFVSAVENPLSRPFNQCLAPHTAAIEDANPAHTRPGVNYNVAPNFAHHAPDVVLPYSVGDRYWNRTLTQAEYYIGADDPPPLAEPANVANPGGDPGGDGDAHAQWVINNALYQAFLIEHARWAPPPGDEPDVVANPGPAPANVANPGDEPDDVANPGPDDGDPGWAASDALYQAFVIEHAQWVTDDGLYQAFVTAHAQWAALNALHQAYVAAHAAWVIAGNTYNTYLEAFQYNTPHPMFPTDDEKAQLPNIDHALRDNIVRANHGVILQLGDVSDFYQRVPVPIVRSEPTTVIEDVKEPLLGFYGMSQFLPSSIYPVVAEFPPFLQTFLYNFKQEEVTNCVLTDEAGFTSSLEPTGQLELSLESYETFKQEDKELETANLLWPKFEVFRSVSTHDKDQTVHCETIRGKPDYVFVQLEHVHDKASDNTGKEPTILKLKFEILGENVKAVSALNADELYHLTRRNSHIHSAVADNYRGIGAVLLTRMDCLDFVQWRGNDGVDMFQLDVTVTNKDYGRVEPKNLDIELKVFFIYTGFSLHGKSHEAQFSYL